MVLVQEGLPRAPGSERTERYIRLADDYAATKAKKPIAFVTPISHGQTDYSRAIRAKAPHVSFLQEAYKALRAIASVARREERERLRERRCRTRRALAPEQRALLERDLRAGAKAEPVALDEAQSKEVLRAYGIATPPEALVDLGGRGARGGRAHRLSGGAQGGGGDAHRTSRTSARWRSIWRRPRNWPPPMTAWRAICRSTASPACWCAGRSAAGWSSCSASIAIPRWAWW